VLSARADRAAAVILSPGSITSFGIRTTYGNRIALRENDLRPFGYAALCIAPASPSDRGSLPGCLVVAARPRVGTTPHIPSGAGIFILRQTENAQVVDAYRNLMRESTRHPKSCQRESSRSPPFSRSPGTPSSTKNHRPGCWLRDRICLLPASWFNFRRTANRAPIHCAPWGPGWRDPADGAEPNRLSALI
jgi:hypothetical protein